MDDDDPSAGYASLSSTGGLQPTQHGWEREFTFFGRQLAIFENRPKAVCPSSNCSPATILLPCVRTPPPPLSAPRPHPPRRPRARAGDASYGLVAWNAALVLCAAFERDLIPGNSSQRAAVLSPRAAHTHVLHSRLLLFLMGRWSCCSHCCCCCCCCCCSSCCIFHSI